MQTYYCANDNALFRNLDPANNVNPQLTLPYEHVYLEVLPNNLF